MAANVYECMFLLDTNKVAGDVHAAEEQIRNLLTRNNAEVLAARPWDERRLAYPIGNHKKGLYYLTYFSNDGTNLATIERDCQLNEMILRMLVLKIDRKLVDTMLALAKDEHAVALHNYQEEPAEGGEGGAPREGNGQAEGRGRRPRRQPAEEEKA